MAKVIAVSSMKGGVGKSTLAVNLAWQSAGPSARRTLLWDIDAQGAASYLSGHDDPGGSARRIFRKEARPGDLVGATAWPRLSLLAADLSLRQLAEDLAEADKPKRLRKLVQALGDNHDRIIIDGPPGLGELSDQVFRAADIVVVPVVPAPLALRALDQMQGHLAKYHGGKPTLLPVFSMVDRRRKLHCEALSAHPDWPAIPQSSMIERMAVNRAPLPAFAPNNPASRIYGDIWAKIEKTLIG
jgi:cellulose biosynthesis protein BcsQ